MTENQRIAARRRSPAERQALVAEFEASGMSRKEFCQSRGLSLHTLHGYLQKGKRVQSKGKLVEVEVGAKEQVREVNLAVVLGKGRRIEVGREFEEKVLQRLVGVLERL